MKTKLTILALLLSVSVKAQVLIFEYQRNISIHENAFAGTIGHLSDINGSMLTGGVILKQYGSHIKPGIRFQIFIPINDLLAFNTFGDAFFQRNTAYEAKFLEVGTGLTLTTEWVHLSALWQMADSNPVTRENRNDCVLLKVGVPVVWRR